MPGPNEALEDIVKRYETILEAAAEGIYGLDTDGRVTFLNRTAEQLTGWPRSEQLGERQHALIHHTRSNGAAYPDTACPIHASLQDGTARHGEELFWRRDGSCFLAAFTSTPLFDDDGRITGTVVTFSDRTAYQVAQRYNALVEAASDFVWTCALDGAVSDISANWLEITGLTREQALGWGWLEALHPRDRERYRRKRIDSLASEKTFVDDLRMLCADGRTRWFRNRLVPVKGADGRILEWVGAGREITRRKLREKRLKRHATLDQLTEALNRWAFEARLDEAIEDTQQENEPFSLVLFDVDHFKAVNDEYGHDTGDTVLKRLADIVGQLVRRSDALGRWGGEEFMLLLPDADIEDAHWLAERLRRRVAGEHFPGPERISISAGIVQHAADESRQSLIKRADNALYEAKNSGRNRVCCAPPPK